TTARRSETGPAYPSRPALKTTGLGFVGKCHEREADQDATKEPGTVGRGQPRRCVVLAPAIPDSGRRDRRRGRGRLGGRLPPPRSLGHGGGQASATSPAEGLFGEPPAEQAEPCGRPLEPARWHRVLLQG